MARPTYSLALLADESIENAINATKISAATFVNAADPTETLESQALAEFVGEAIPALVELEIYFGDAFTDRVTGLIVPGPESFASIGSRAYSLLPNSIVVRDVKIEP